jgi:hypothetical protein
MARPLGQPTRGFAVVDTPKDISSAKLKRVDSTDGVSDDDDEDWEDDEDWQAHAAGSATPPAQRR